MMGESHRRMGIFAGVAVAIAGILTGNSLWVIMLVTTPFGAMLPDIDHNRTKLGRARKKVFSVLKVCIIVVACVATLFLVKEMRVRAVIPIVLIATLLIAIIKLLGSSKRIQGFWKFVTKHRGIMHSLVPPAICIWVGIVSGIPAIKYLLFGLALGDVVHLIGDMVSLEDVPILWPIIKRSFNIPIVKTDSNKEPLVANVLGVMISCVIFAAGMNLV